MNIDSLTTIDDEALESVTGAGIGSTIGSAIDGLLGLAGNVIGGTLDAAGSLLSAFGSWFKKLG